MQGQPVVYHQRPRPHSKAKARNSTSRDSRGHCLKGLLRVQEQGQGRGAGQGQGPGLGLGLGPSLALHRRGLEMAMQQAQAAPEPPQCLGRPGRAAQALVYQGDTPRLKRWHRREHV